MAPFVALHRIRGSQLLEFREFVPATACVFFPHVLILVIRCTAHCHQQCASANFANSASHTSFERHFFAGHDPFAHACQARPLTNVGWTSESVSLSLSSGVRGQPRRKGRCRHFFGSLFLVWKVSNKGREAVHVPWRRTHMWWLHGQRERESTDCTGV